MILRKKMSTLLLFVLLSGSAAPATAYTTLSEKLVSRFSKDWNSIQDELAIIEQELETLPNIPLMNVGGTGGMISYSWDTIQELNVFVHWDTPAAIDLVALVPARRFNTTGLDPEFGLPNFIEIELLDENDHSVYLVASEDAAASRPIKKGFPFIYSLPKPILAHGIRIRCKEFKNHAFSGGQLYALALAELFCFSGSQNVAKQAEVSLLEDTITLDQWFWRPDFLVDSLTPLGLPEIPTTPFRHIGWLSRAHNSVNTDTFTWLADCLK